MFYRYFIDILQNINKKFDEYVRGMATGGTFFEELGFYYVGPVDAHDLDNLVPIIENIRDNVPNTKPVLLHVKSVKGKGKQKYCTILNRFLNLISTTIIISHHSYLISLCCRTKFNYFIVILYRIP